MDEKYNSLINTLSEDGKKIFNKLSAPRQEVVSMILNNINSGKLTWSKGWNGGEMRNPVTGIRYKGVNSILLMLFGATRNYNDCRWVTFNQMCDKKWKFKTDANGNSLGKGAGIPIEYFTFFDTKTKKPIDWKAFNSLELDAQREYWKKNIRTLVKSYVVFNCSLMEGVPELKATSDVKAELNKKVESILEKSEAPISYDGGDRAYYSLKEDAIHLPPRSSFISYEEFLGTALHELGHSTGHPTRLNREMGGGFGSSGYAKEELRAELFSVFAQQEYDVKLSDKQLENHSAYLQSWKDEIRDNPNYIFYAIADAQKIVNYVDEHYFGKKAQSQEKAELEIDKEEEKSYSSAFLEMMNGMAPSTKKASENVKVNANKNEDYNS